MATKTKAKSTKVLSKLLEKRGINRIEDLAPEEAATFEKWKVVLSGENLTVDTIKEFCEQQIRIIESKCNGTEPLSMLQQACIHVYINILKVIEAPAAERESLEKYLTQLVNTS